MDVVKIEVPEIEDSESEIPQAPENPLGVALSLFQRMYELTADIQEFEKAHGPLTSYYVSGTGFVVLLDEDILGSKLEAAAKDETSESPEPAKKRGRRTSTRSAAKKRTAKVARKKI